MVDRKHEIRAAAPPASAIKQRIAQAADELSRAGSLALHVELANEALTKFTLMLYQREQDGGWANIDTRTHRLLVPAPWGSAGWRVWGLRKWEGAVLRAIMLDRVNDTRRPCLFDYNGEARLWHLNVTAYGVIEAAQHYLQRSPITLAEWRKYAGSYLESEAERKRKLSGK